MDDEVLHAVDGTAYTIDQLHQRVSIVDEGIVLIREVPDGTGEIWEALALRGKAVAQRFGKYCWVVDISMVNIRPKGTYLESVRRNIASSDAEWIYLVTPVGSILRTIAKFAVGFMIKKVTFVPTVEEGIREARGKLGV